MNIAWANENEVISPNGRFTALVKNADEFAMGGPTVGTLTISNGYMDDTASPSIAFSSNNKLFAYAKWIGRQCFLVVIELDSNKEIFRSGPFSVIEITGFFDTEIHFTESPIYLPKFLIASVTQDPNR